MFKQYISQFFLFLITKIPKIDNCVLLEHYEVWSVVRSDVISVSSWVRVESGLLLEGLQATVNVSAGRFWWRDVLRRSDTTQTTGDCLVLLWKREGLRGWEKKWKSEKFRNEEVGMLKRNCKTRSDKMVNWKLETGSCKRNYCWWELGRVIQWLQNKR